MNLSFASRKSRWHWTAAGAVLLALALHAPVWWRQAPYLSFHLLYYAAPSAPPPAGLPPLNPSLHDQTYQLYPLVEETRAAVRAGELPLWTDAYFCGAPLLANGVAAVLHPLQWLALAVPGAWGPTAAAVAKSVLAALLMLGYLKRLGAGPLPALLGAIGFAGHGLLITFLLFPNATVAIHLPALAWALEEIRRGSGARAYAALALVCASGLLAGHPEVFFLLASSAGAYGLLIFWWDRPRAAAPSAIRLTLGSFVAALLGAALAGVQLLPFVDYLSRSAAFGKRAGLDLHLEPGAAIVSLVPDFFGHIRFNNYWGTLDDTNEAAFVSLALIVLALLPLGWPQRPRLPALLGVLGLLSLALGYGLWPIAPIVRALPGFDRALPSRLNTVVAFSLCALAALRLDRLLDASAAPVRRRLRQWLPLVAGALLAAVAAAWYDYRGWIPSAAAAAALRQAVAYFVALLAGACLALLLLTHRRLAWLGALLLSALTLLPIYRYALGFNTVVPTSIPRPAPGAIRYLRGVPGWFRIAAIGAILPPNGATLYDLRDIRGIDALTPGYYESFLRLADPGSSDIWKLPALASLKTARSSRAPEALRARTWNRSLGRLEQQVPGQAQRASSLVLLFDPSSRLLDLLGLRFLLVPSGAGQRIVSQQPQRWRRVYAGEVDILENQSPAPAVGLASGIRSARSEEQALAILRSVDLPLSRQVVVLDDERRRAGPIDRSPLDASETAKLIRQSPTRWEIETRTAANRLLVLSAAWDPGWQASVDGTRAPVIRADLALRAVPVPSGRHRVVLRYLPRSLIAGLVTTLLAAAVLATLWHRGRRSGHAIGP